MVGLSQVAKLRAWCLGVLHTSMRSASRKLDRWLDHMEAQAVWKAKSDISVSSQDT